MEQHKLTQGQIDVHRDTDAHSLLPLAEGTVSNPFLSTGGQEHRSSTSEPSLQHPITCYMDHRAPLLGMLSPAPPGYEQVHMISGMGEYNDTPGRWLGSGRHSHHHMPSLTTMPSSFCSKVFLGIPGSVLQGTGEPSSCLLITVWRAEAVTGSLFTNPGGALPGLCALCTLSRKPTPDLSDEP